MGMKTLGRRAGAAGLAAVLLLGVAACGDDDDAATDTDDEAAESDGGDTGDLAAWCEPNVELTLLFNAEEPPSEAQAEPLLEDFVDNAPDEIAEESEVMATTARGVLSGESSPEEAFDQPAFQEASSAVDAYAFDNCDAATSELTTVDYAFEGLPEEVEAGLNIMRVTNDGAELHEVLLLRRNDDASQSFEEILGLSEEEGRQLVTEGGFTFVGEPGNTTYLYAELEPGDYAAVCFLPVGATDFATLETLGGDASPHFTQGMLQEFTVAE